jgi:hypothetical protein
VSVSKAIDEELVEIDLRLAQLEARKRKLMEARRILNGSTVDISARGTRSADEWRRAILAAGRELSNFTVAEVAHELDAETTQLYRFVNELETEGKLIRLEELGDRRARMYTVAEVTADA